MKILSLLVTVLIFSNIHAQTEMPKGFKKGTLVLADGTVKPGYIKENIHSNAAVTFLAEAGAKKINYSGSDLNAATIDSTSFLCIQGDFFIILSDGDVCLIQKQSNVSAKPSYNGTEAIFINGTAGTRGDYFIYNKTSKQLRMITKKEAETYNMHAAK